MISILSFNVWVRWLKNEVFTTATVYIVSKGGTESEIF